MNKTLEQNWAAFRAQNRARNPAIIQCMLEQDDERGKYFIRIPNKQALDAWQNTGAQRADILRALPFRCDYEHPKRKKNTIGTPQESQRLQTELQKAQARITQLEQQMQAMQSKARKHAAIRQIQQYVSTALQIDLPTLLGKQREQKIARARQIALWVTSQCRPDLSISQIGRAFNRDHTTVLYTIKRINEAIANGEEWACMAEAIKQQLKGETS